MSLTRLSEVVAEHRYVQPADGTERVNHHVWCPGCDKVHALNVVGPEPWTWDGNAEAPTYGPSLLVTHHRGLPSQTVCHSFIRAGLWEFLTDSHHALAGQAVPMAPYPEEYL